jgi:hypothetical protein
MKKILLTRGWFALVDLEDYDTLCQYKWYCSRAGYAERTWTRKGVKYRIGMHRQILGLKPADGKHSDHINHNRLDNRRSNLRVVTQAENNRNRRDNTTGYPGVRWVPRKNLYRAQLQTSGKFRHLGYFSTSEEAHTAFQRAVLHETAAA